MLIQSHTCACNVCFVSSFVITWQFRRIDHNLFVCEQTDTKSTVWTHTTERRSIKTDKTARSTRHWSRRHHRVTDTFCNCIEDRRDWRQLHWIMAHTSPYLFFFLSNCFILLRLNPLGQRKLSIVISLSRMLCFGRVCASPCALNVSAALQGAYNCTYNSHIKKRKFSCVLYVHSQFLCSLQILNCQPW